MPTLHAGRGMLRARLLGGCGGAVRGAARVRGGVGVSERAHPLHQRRALALQAPQAPLLRAQLVHGTLVLVLQLLDLHLHCCSVSFFWLWWWMLWVQCILCFESNW